MAKLELTRVSGERHLYRIEGVGTLRVTGWASRGASAEAGGQTWQITRRGFFRPVIQAADETGAVVGVFMGRALQRGGVLRWSGRELALRRDSRWRARYGLVEGDRRLATMHGRAWGKPSLTITVDDESAVDRGLLLFAAFVVLVLTREGWATVASA